MQPCQAPFRRLRRVVVLDEDHPGLHDCVSQPIGTARTDSATDRRCRGPPGFPHTAPQGSVRTPETAGKTTCVTIDPFATLVPEGSPRHRCAPRAGADPGLRPDLPRAEGRSLMSRDNYPDADLGTERTADYTRALVKA